MPKKQYNVETVTRKLRGIPGVRLSMVESMVTSIEIEADACLGMGVWGMIDFLDTTVIRKEKRAR